MESENDIGDNEIPHVPADALWEVERLIKKWTIVWLGSSLVECSHGKRETLGSNLCRATFFFRPCDIWWLSVGPCSGCEQQKGTVSSVPACFIADSGTNLIKQGGNVTGRSCGSVAQW